MGLDHSPPVGLCTWEHSQEILIYHNHSNPWNSALSGLQQKSLYFTGLRRMKVQCRSSSRVSLLKEPLDPGEEGRSNAEKGSASYKFFLSVSHEPVRCSTGQDGSRFLTQKLLSWSYRSRGISAVLQFNLCPKQGQLRDHCVAPGFIQRGLGNRHAVRPHNLSRQHLTGLIVKYLSAISSWKLWFLLCLLSLALLTHTTMKTQALSSQHSP